MALLLTAEARTRETQQRSLGTSCLFLTCTVVLTSELDLLRFNPDSYSLRPALLYLPVSSEEFLIEKFGPEVHPILAFSLPLLPVLAVTLATLVIGVNRRRRILAERPGGVRHGWRGGSLHGGTNWAVTAVVVLFGVAKLLGIPIFLLFHKVSCDQGPNERN